jgi:hypothetical protein
MDETHLPLSNKIVVSTVFEKINPRCAMTKPMQNVVIGAGAIGLAVARELAKRGKEVLVLEAARAIGSGISSRNSEVIHASIYYPPKSLKATLCLHGKKLMYEYCKDHNVSHRRCGKLIVATDKNQIGKLEELKRRAEENGVNDLRWISGDEARDMEKNLWCERALLSPSTGILDSRALMSSLHVRWLQCIFCCSSVCKCCNTFSPALCCLFGCLVFFIINLLRWIVKPWVVYLLSTPQ